MEHKNSRLFEITDAQKQMLMKSEEDIRNGNVISNDDLNAEEDQWLNEPPIPEWQKKEVRKRLKDLKKNPSKAINWNDATKRIKRLAK